MYDVDGRDQVVELTRLPQCNPGAPLPRVAATEHIVLVAYLRQDFGSGQDVVVTVTFSGAYAHMFGPPNDEAFDGHPLADRGLRPYGAFRVDGSSWVRRMERMNSVHEHHDPKTFEALTHFILSFHDTTFECAAKDMSYETTPGHDVFTLSVDMGLGRATI